LRVIIPKAGEGRASPGQSDTSDCFCIVRQKKNWEKEKRDQQLEK
jgi:hypothetical protein